MRTTQPQIRSAFRMVKTTAIRAGIPGADGWELDYAPHYGGWCVERNGGSASFGGHGLSANRMQAGAFYQMLRVLLDLVEIIERGES